MSATSIVSSAHANRFNLEMHVHFFFFDFTKVIPLPIETENAKPRSGEIVVSGILLRRNNKRITVEERGMNIKQVER